MVEKALWAKPGAASAPPESLGRGADGQRSEPLAITQLLLYHLLDAAR